MVTIRHHGDAAHEGDQHEQGQHNNGLGEMVRTVGRVVKLQIRIYIEKFKSAAKRAIIAAVLGIASGVLLLMALVFLEFGLFHLFTEICGFRLVWTGLIMAGIHVVVAGVLAFAAQYVIRKPTEEDSGGSHAD